MQSLYPLILYVAMLSTCRLAVPMSTSMYFKRVYDVTESVLRRLREEAAQPTATGTVSCAAECMKKETCWYFVMRNSECRLLYVESLGNVSSLSALYDLILLSQLILFYITFYSNLIL